jgi:chromosome segregation ATPase
MNNKDFKEIRALKEQVSRSESCIQKLQRDKTLIELRFNTLDEEKSTAQSLINVYKAELDEFRSKYYENDRQLNNYDGVL